MSTHLVICAHHRLLAHIPILGRRWHMHLTKPIDLVGSSDYEFIQKMQDSYGRWWRFDNLGQQELPGD